MTTLLVLFLLGFVGGFFAYEAHMYCRKAELWEKRYLAEKANLDRVLDELEEHFQ